ncbi:3-hydroxybenzoate 6-hydroxylase 1 [Fusarium beomiforme]|uniref:3-hydroxybenzoate 6-hydroxylase 1 n=1 Tax=Fusarium beomiforme TaxID=44412 RepID=A0A9P5ASF8_9HYPO|nr:3-hydroxybenzoate 6-hydroxylase 1 [Fusarium beomiforme]
MGFKVIIVGGSVAGLSVANMLEQFDIDYVLLEAYPHIAPQVGASIGILPNGFRILDQLGCYEPILDIAGECRYTLGSMRGSNGVPLTASSDTSLSVHFEKRTGYPSIFIDRQMLLQVLHNNVKHKDRILANKRVTRVELTTGGARVHTQDACTFDGDVVVGADGIHSRVRDEMWRLGKEQSPGYFPEDETSRIPVSTRCIFGISNRPSGYGTRSQQGVIGQGHSYLVIAAPMNRTYWFLFDGLRQTEYGKDISKYSKADEEALVKAHRNDPITEDLVFGDLYDRKIMSTLVPLEEYVFERWHYKRIITIGDSAHKIDPASGQGGNGAIEAAALLVNSLVKQLKLNPHSLSEPQIEAALANVHTLRYERSRNLVAQAHMLQKISSQRMPFASLFTYLLPLFGPTAFADVVVPVCSAAPKIEGIPVPRRPHCVPFEDELPAKPLKASLVRRVPWILASGSLGMLVSVALGKSSIGGGTAISNTFHQLGIGGVLAKLAGLKAATGLAINLIPTLATWVIEGSRNRSVLDPLSWTSLHSVIYTLAGPTSMPALFCLSSALFSSPSVTQRPVNAGVAKSIVPGVVLGYIAPTLGALLIEDDKYKHQIGRLWRAHPLLCIVFTRGLAALQIGRHNKSRPEEAEKKTEKKPIDFISEHELETYKGTDVLPLKFAYCSAFAACIVLPFATKLALTAGTHVLKSTVDANLTKTLGFVPSISAINAASSLIYCLYSAWELRSLGFVKTKQAVIGGFASLAALGLAGPGAAIAGISYWRECVISGLGFSCS